MGTPIVVQDDHLYCGDIMCSRIPGSVGLVCERRSIPAPGYTVRRSVCLTIPRRRGPTRGWGQRGGAKRRKLDDIEHHAMHDEDQEELADLFDHCRTEYIKERDGGADGIQRTTV